MQSVLLANTVLLIALATGIATAHATSSSCKRPSSAPTDALERKALAYTVAHAKTCRLANVTCNYQIARTKHHGISIRVNYVWWDEQLHECIQAGDGIQDYLYDANGRFLKVDSGT